MLDSSARGSDQCFVCEPGGGLQVAFSHEPLDKTVTAEVTFGEAQGGHQPGRAHPGAVLAILEDAMAWSVVAMGGSAGVPKRSTTEFLRPVKVGETYRVVGRLISRHEDGLDVAATLVREDGQPCVEARSRYLPVGEAGDGGGAADGPDAAAAS